MSRIIKTTVEWDTSVPTVEGAYYTLTLKKGRYFANSNWYDPDTGWRFDGEIVLGYTSCPIHPIDPVYEDFDPVCGDFDSVYEDFNPVYEESKGEQKMNKKEKEAVTRAVQSLRAVHYGNDKSWSRMRATNNVYEDLVEDLGPNRAKELWSEICTLAKEV